MGLNHSREGPCLVLNLISIEIDDPESDMLVLEIFCSRRRPNQGSKEDVTKQLFTFSSRRCLKPAFTYRHRILFNVINSVKSLRTSRALRDFKTLPTFPETSMSLKSLRVAVVHMLQHFVSLHSTLLRSTAIFFLCSIQTSFLSIASY
ncbi:hypothetical protein TNCV_3835281 [Trichonephila clavipes]|nr:hypothetical protein TNCV_3835281 [Trichonephila clavipes]